MDAKSSQRELPVSGNICSGNQIRGQLRNNLTRGCVHPFSMEKACVTERIQESAITIYWIQQQLDPNPFLCCVYKPEQYILQSTSEICGE